MSWMDTTTKDDIHTETVKETTTTKDDIHTETVKMNFRSPVESYIITCNKK